MAHHHNRYKGLFVSIPLCPKDSKHFAFTVPSCNHEEPDQRYEWVVLPQGMANSPTMCQLFVGATIAPLRKKFPNLRAVSITWMTFFCLQKMRKFWI